MTSRAAPPFAGNHLVPFSHLDSPGIARTLSQIADESTDSADVFFERQEEIMLPAGGATPGIRLRREEGLAVRLSRGNHSWMASRDQVSSEAFREAVRRAARALPRASYPQPEIEATPWDPSPPETSGLFEFPSKLHTGLRSLGVHFAVDSTLRYHRRWVRLIGTTVSSATETEIFSSLVARMPWGRFGALLPSLDQHTVERTAQSLLRLFQARDSPPPKTRKTQCVLGAAATAVFLHEAVAHALEADTLALGGHPEAAIGVSMGSSLLNVFDDPGNGPRSVRRNADDEGFPATRRCLLRAGVVEQPICDHAWARRSDLLTAGAGRRGHRRSPPVPRSTHLELAPGAASLQELLSDAEGGLYLPEAERGSLDPLTGAFTLHFPYGRQILNGAPGGPVGPCSLSGRVADLLGRVTGVGSEVQVAGAGWCAKGGIKLPVWATVPEIRLEDVEICG